MAVNLFLMEAGESTCCSRGGGTKTSQIALDTFITENNHENAVFPCTQQNYTASPSLRSRSLSPPFRGLHAAVQLRASSRVFFVAR